MDRTGKSQAPHEPVILPSCSKSLSCYKEGCECAEGREASRIYMREYRLRQEIKLHNEAIDNELNSIVSRLFAGFIGSTLKGMFRYALERGFDLADKGRYNGLMVALIDETNIPRYALFRERRVRITEYLGNGKFQIVDTDDSTRSVYRAQLTFLPEKVKK